MHSLEANPVLIAASIPTLKPILKSKGSRSTMGQGSGPINSWVPSHQGCSQSKTGNNGSFVPLKDRTLLPDDSSNDEAAFYKGSEYLLNHVRVGVLGTPGETD